MLKAAFPVFRRVYSGFVMRVAFYNSQSHAGSSSSIGTAKCGWVLAEKTGSGDEIA